MKTHSLKKIAISAAFATFATTSQAEFTANIGMTTNYVWRGVTQTMDGAAVQGGVDYSHDSGFYVGTWASNIDWLGGDSGIEWDIYGGFAGEVGDFGYDIGLIYYMYPTSGYEDSNFFEAAASVSYRNVSAGLNYTISGESGGYWDEGDIYYWAGVSFDLPEEWSIGLTVGYYDFDAGGSAGDYAHGQVDLGKSVGDFGDFTLSLSSAEASDTSSDDLLVFVSWSKEF